MNADAIAAAHPLGDEQAGEPIGALGELAVGERLTGAAHGRAVGIARGRPIDGVVQQEEHRHVAHRQTPSSRATMLRWMSEVPA